MTEQSDTLPPPPSITARITRVADLAATLLFALEGGLVAIAAGFDPVGVLVICFVSALGGGLIRDVLTGYLPPAAVSSRIYAALVIIAAAIVWTLNGLLQAVPQPLVVALDAGGLALAAIAGTEKSLDRGIEPLVAIFLGTVSGVGGGTIRDVLINQVPRVLHTDVYASAACLAAIVVVAGRVLKLPPRACAVAAFLVCFSVRMAAYTWHWELPKLVV